MKRLIITLIAFIMLSNMSVCSFAFVATEDEVSACYNAAEYLMMVISKEYGKTDYDLSNYTINHFGEDSNLKEEILEKAKQHEDEIRANHLYHYYEDNIWDTEITDHVKQYDKVPIEDVISSFPIFIEKKAQYYAAKNSQAGDTFDDKSYVFSPNSVIVSESGFAYVNIGSCYVLLYKYRAAAEDVWIVCDISTFWDSYDEKYRFHSEKMDVERELLAIGCVLYPEEMIVESDLLFGTSESGEQDIETDNISAEVKNTLVPENYMTWILCAESTIILVLALALAFKKKKS